MVPNDRIFTDLEHPRVLATMPERARKEFQKLPTHPNTAERVDWDYLYEDAAPNKTRLHKNMPHEFQYTRL